MRKLVIAFAVTMIAVGSANASLTEYTSRTAWEAAVTSFLTESFDDATLNAGITATAGDAAGGVVTDNLDPYYQMWWDIVDDDPAQETVFNFDPDIYAWGGDWDLVNPGGPGLGISVYIDGSIVGSAPTVDRETTGFYGIVSTVAFDEVRLGSGEQVGEIETYTLDDMVLSLIHI